ncbi:tRNA lysidine(34) synthetase TilS [Vibrio sp. Hep-1b-8]|uniref:tRNA lysidine(34) synthetase TilS n=1 Tax=Vibrio sp. Hep-1b-8 TaxID=2144187 RepID=UPI001110E004|nr:tRNA lysidine(34) synthetase TilS [Vibrio sp. Hep-1b-8]TMX31932.1 tRNA lysidine(34) synthetase TilS [Vibrio sp. Hep-1b-8]
MSLKSHFATVIERHAQAQGRLVLGLSGGLDSRVMLDLMAEYSRSQQTECLAVHVHHGLSVNADQWARQCQQWCQQLNVPLVIEKVQLDRKGRSLEESAREARYQALVNHLENDDLLLTGQHADDQVETFLLALKRGSGPKGLSAMAEAMPFAHAKIVRPLLTISRQQIEGYAEQKQLTWVEDESNLDQRFERNFIRHTVSPPLTERWPYFNQAVQRSAELCAEQEALLDELMSDKLNSALHSDASLDINTLATYSELVRTRALRMWLARQNVRMPSREQLKLVWPQVACAQQDANPQFALIDGQIRRHANRLYFVREWQPLMEWRQDLRFDQACVLPEDLGRLVLRSSSHGQLSKQALSQGKLQVIFEPQGLSAHPVERGHSRKLKKLFQEYDVPSWLRRRIPIVICDQQVVAVGDLFIDRHFAGQDCELVWDKPLLFM